MNQLEVHLQLAPYDGEHFAQTTRHNRGDRLSDVGLPAAGVKGMALTSFG